MNPEPLENPGLQEKWHQCCERYEEHVRKEPIQAALTAAAVGYALNYLPVRRLSASILGLLFTLAGPAILIFTALRLTSLITERTEKKPEDEPELVEL